jgi:hypothetical protein
VLQARATDTSLVKVARHALEDGLTLHILMGVVQMPNKPLAVDVETVEIAVRQR